MIDTAVVLAGGLGTRLKSIVPDLPKPMAPICGRPFLAFLLDYWVGQGIKRFVLSVGYKHQAIMNYFGRSINGVTIEYVVEDAPLGTGGGLLLVYQRLALSSPFLLLNGDTYFAIELKKFSELAKQVDADWCFSLFSMSDNGRYLGVDVNDKGEISNLLSSIGTGERLVNGGVYLVNPRSLLALNLPLENKISLEEEIFPLLIAQGHKVFGLAFDNKFIDIGVPEDYKRAAELIA
jgi:D-glycero-alpha-D-manno-heptose 1-phosphate guanylyltransferase